jgi:gliding motility-associated protein GldM
MAGMKETPRQKMIGMMYLVLTCLLALNVSKDILKGFVTVNESLEKTNKGVQLSNEKMLAEFEKIAEKKESAKAYYDKAIESRKLTMDAVVYIDKLKKKLIEISEDVNALQADTMHLRFIEKLEEYDKTTFQLIGSDENNPVSKEYSAKELRGNMNVLCNKLDGIIEDMNAHSATKLPSGDYISLKEKIKMLRPVDSNETIDDLKMTWELQNFYNLPIAAVITNLSKIQSDIKNLETEMINQFASASGKQVIIFNSFAAKVVAPSKYIRSGENYMADIILSASSSDFNSENMQILVGARYDTASKKLINEGSPLMLAGGAGKFDIKTSGQGDQTLSGVIKFKNGKGETEYYPFEDKYTVAAPSSAVSADKMNVFYAGLLNPLTISAAGVAPTNLVAKINGNNAPLIPEENGKYSIKPVTTGTCEVAVYSKEANGQLKLQGIPTKFRVKSLPIPFVKINGKFALGNYEIRKTEVPSLTAISADIPGFDLDARYKIKSYNVITALNGIFNDSPCTGFNFSQDAKTSVSKVKAGGRIFIEKIIAVGPDGKEVPLSDVIIRVKS